MCYHRAVKVKVYFKDDDTVVLNNIVATDITEELYTFVDKHGKEYTYNRDSIYRILKQFGVK